MKILKFKEKVIVIVENSAVGKLEKVLLVNKWIQLSQVSLLQDTC